MSDLEDVLRPCQSCGKANDRDAHFCKHCAFDLHSLTSGAPTPSSQDRLSSTANKLALIIASLAFIAAVVAIGLIYKRSNDQIQTTNSTSANTSVSSAASPNTTINQPPTSSNTVIKPPPMAPSGGSTPAEQGVEMAIKKAFENLKREGKTDSVPGLRVNGIQELPGSNEAKADINLTNAALLQDDMLNGQWEIGPGGVGGRMIYPKKRIRIENCTAKLKHYNNGRWVLESIDTHSYESGVIKVNIDL